MTKQKLTGPQGFFTGLSLTNEELIRIQCLIKDQWLRYIKVIAPEHVNRFDELGIDRYHETSHLLDHHSMWPTRVRTFPREVYFEIRKMGFFDKLEAILGPFEVIFDDWYGGIIWRLVRPNAKNDTGPLHADAWFHELGNNKAPDNMYRIKIWIGIHVEPGLNGFIFVPGSHLKSYPYHGEMRNGLKKPVIDFSEDSLSPILFKGEPGDAIIFHDRLLHKGAINQGNHTRVSIEFTVLAKRW